MSTTLKNAAPQAPAAHGHDADLGPQTRRFIELNDQYGAHNYHPLPVVIHEGRGAWVIDVDGKRYLDCLSAYSALNFGHNHPDLVRALKDQLDRVALTSRAFHNDQLAPFFKDLAELCGMEMVLPMNTGAEAVETAIKTARKWGYERKGVPANQARIMVFTENFHGRTTTIVGFSTDPQSYGNFGPFAPGFDIVKYGDIDAARRAFTPQTVAVMIEPIQGEAGIIMPPDGYLRQLRDLCTQNKALFMADEIQTGLGRTGKLFACEWEGIRPDVFILGKALGGGILPVSAVVSSRDIMSVFKPGEHGSTFGGNPLAAAVGRQAVKMLREGDFVKRAQEQGQYFMQQLRAMNSPKVQEIRGRGLLIGLQLKVEAGRARPVCENLMRRGMLCKDTHEQVIRFAPPLVIDKKDIDWAVGQVAEALGA
jgi:ornithine--oxo-acid transaminase